MKDECENCHGTGAKPGTTPQTCPKCGGKGQVVYTQQSLFGMVQNVRPCPDCNGTGKIIKDKCPNCYGTGYTSSKKKIAVTIPAGIDNGQSIRIRGKGEPGTNGGPRGDLSGRSGCIQTSDFPETGYGYLLHSTDQFPGCSIWEERSVSRQWTAKLSMM